MATPSIRVTNVREREVLEHPLVLLEGVVEHMYQLAPHGELLFLLAELDATRGSFWPVAPTSGRYKAFALLPAPGRYTLTLRLTRGATVAGAPYFELLHRTFEVVFAPRATRYVVRFYYQKCVDAVDGFDAPLGTDNSDAAAIATIRFNALLLQTLTAEMLVHAGLPRRTFAVEFASDGLPLVRLLRSTFTNATARSVDDQQLIRLVHDDIDAFGLDTDDVLTFKHAVILGCSTFNAATQRAEGHTALGGDKVGVFGSCGLHTWPQHLGGVTAACLNNAKVDACAFLDDSCYRGTFWANFATGIGAFLHELGHTFGLGHAHTGIMGRGFDDMNRLLCAFEIDPHSAQPGFFAPPAGSSSDGRLQLNLAALREVTGPAGAHWNAGSARLLQHCAWLAGVPAPSTLAPTVSWTRDACGPVGQGLYDGDQVAFTSSSTNSNEPLGAICITADNFVHRVQTFTRAEVARGVSDTDGPTSRASGHTHLFVLLDNEVVTRVDVRAMAFVDGMQIHTNRRTSRWFGGVGGALSVLQPSPGYAITNFFGTRGDRFVGTLGVRCSALPVHDALALVQPNVSVPDVELAPTELLESVPSLTVAGLALSDGVQRTFTTQTPALQAIAVTCDAFVTSVRVLSHAEHECAVRDPSAVASASSFGAREHVFELVAGEHIERVVARSGFWLDSVQFVTNLRTSPTFGGTGGTNTAVLDAPAGYALCGLFGTRGDRFVGSLGALFAPMTGPMTAAPAPTVSSRSPYAAVEAFSAVTGARSTAEADSLHVGASPAIGVVVATQCDRVTFVQSFASAQTFDALVTHIYSTQPCDRVMCFWLEPHELLLQLDVNVSVFGSDSSESVVDGVCFHTTARCSTWFGACGSDASASALRFVVAPDGCAIRDVASVLTSGALTDVVGHTCSAAAAAVVTAPPRALRFEPDGRVAIDAGSSSGDVRLESRSAFGLASAHLLATNGGDHLNCCAWDWSAPAPLPRRWFLAHRVLLDKVAALVRHSSRSDSTSNGFSLAELLVRDYIVGALDSGGGFSKAAAPPALQ